jgi:hypothetical protein
MQQAITFAPFAANHRRTTALIVAVTLLFTAVTACDKAVPTADSIESLSKSLTAAGLSVQPAATPDRIDAGLFNTTSALITASREKVLAYEFATEAEAEAAASKVVPDGSGIGLKYVNWRATPHFYRRGKLIVIYEGEQKLMTDTLSAAMGPRFAGGEPETGT